MNRKPLFIVGGIVAGLLLLFFIIGLFLPKNGALTITAPSSTPISVAIESDDAAYRRTALIDAADSQQYILRPGSYKVVSTAAASKSIDIVTITAEKATELKVSFAAASTATKMAAGLDFCPAVVQDKVYDYDCNSYGFIYEQSKADETKSILFDSQWFDSLTAYKDGFLGYPVNSGLHYINLATGQMIPISLPADLADGTTQSLIKVAAPRDPTKSYFALSLSSKNLVYLFKDAADANPLKIKLPRNDFLSRKGFMDWLSFSGERLLVYAGPLNDEDQNEGTTVLTRPEAPKGGGKIVEFDLNGIVTKSVETPPTFTADRVLKLTEKYYAADRIEGVEFFYFNGRELESIHTISEVVASVPIKDKLYMQAENDIYLFTPGDRGGFSIKSTYTPRSDETLNDIYPGPGYLLFTATPLSKEVANVYRLD
ncbi:MAG TPA: hypothetical protein VFM05_03510 [Candidatus Saccharimonadales bacterium]|nr:hypothetical protein [Candidatus Saccharimonadales bacterium]